MTVTGSTEEPNTSDRAVDDAEEDAAGTTDAATNSSADPTTDGQPAAGALRNRRPSGKIRRRLRR